MKDHKVLSAASSSHDLVKRFRSWMSRIQIIVRYLGLEDALKIDEDRLGKAIIDYFDDIDRLKEYEGIEHASVSKIYAYETYWLVKRKPIMPVSPDLEDERIVFINEIACSMILLSNICNELGIIPVENDPHVEKFYDLLCYSLKYRDIPAKALELAIEFFFFGRRTEFVHKNVR